MKVDRFDKQYTNVDKIAGCFGLKVYQRCSGRKPRYVHVWLESVTTCHCYCDHLHCSHHHMTVTSIVINTIVMVASVRYVVNKVCKIILWCQG